MYWLMKDNRGRCPIEGQFVFVHYMNIHKIIVHNQNPASRVFHIGLAFWTDLLWWEGVLVVPFHIITKKQKYTVAKIALIVNDYLSPTSSIKCCTIFSLSWKSGQLTIISLRLWHPKYPFYNNRSVWTAWVIGCRAVFTAKPLQVELVNRGK